MDARRWDQIDTLFSDLVELTETERDARLASVGAVDAELRRHVEALIAADREVEQRLSPLEAWSHASEDGASVTTEFVPDPFQLTGRRVSHFRVLEPVGAGGMGVVYRGEDVQLRREVALKFLLPQYSLDPVAKERFLREARSAAALDHPNICTIHEVAESEEGRLFLAMTRYAGETLKERLAREGALPIARAREIACQIARGLAAAHDAGIVHRDLKAGNLMLTPDGTVKILDFGLAKVRDLSLTASGVQLGTVAYMAPEQLGGKPSDARADLWALGVVLYEMLTGRRPFEAEHEVSIAQAILHDEPPRPGALRAGIPKELEGVVLRLMRKEPAERYSTAEEVVDGLRDAAGHPSGALERSDELRHLGAVAASLPVTRGKRTEPVRWGAARRFGDEVRRRVSIAALLGLVGLLVAAGVIAERIVQRDGDESGAGAGDDALTIAVSPFTPVTSDSALEQLGRELAVTVAVALDGIEDLRTVDPRVVRAQATAAVPGSPRDRGLRLARGVGAGWFLAGRLTRWGATVRVDVTLYAVTESGSVARATTTGDPDDLAALTGSVALALLRSLWQDRPVVSPSLGAIRMARSVTALRACLEGEAFMARGDMPRAVDAFDRAFAADTTFWFAYWRSLYARAFYDSGSTDTARIRQLIEHRHEFRPQDRMLIEGWRADTLRHGHRLLRLAAAEFGSYWPAWYAYANVLVHRAPYLGTTYEDARKALERTVELNPDFSPAWEKLSWVVFGQRDLVATARVLDELERTTSGVGFRSVERRRARFVLDLERFGVPPPDSLERVLDWILSEPERLVTSFATGVGVPSGQLGLNSAILARERRPHVIAALWRGNAYAWVSRGAWDSALVAIDRAANAWPEAMTALDAYGLAVTGAVLGVSAVGEAVRRRPLPVSRWRELDAARLAWLDGLLAYVRTDYDGLARARNTLKESSTIFADALEESLAVFATDAAGDRARAARELARLEWDNANLGRPPPLDARYPFLVPVNRLVAARWLRETGGDSEAARLLTWAEATRTEWPTPMNVTFGSIGLVDRAEIAESLGQTDRARSYYTRFLERHDMPVPELVPMVERARDGVQRLGTIP